MGYTNEVSDGPCSLRAGISQSNPDRIVLEYEFRNDSGHVAFVFDRIWRHVRPETSFLIEEHRCWVEVAADSATLSGKIIDVPEPMFVERRNIPLVTKVGSGERHVGRMIAGLPLRTDTPYHDEEATTDTVRERPLWIEIGYFVPPPEGALLARAVRTSLGSGLQFDPFPIESQRVLRAGPLSSAIPACDDIAPA
jgi:hypothetical protein